MNRAARRPKSRAGALPAGVRVPISRSGLQWFATALNQLEVLPQHAALKLQHWRLGNVISRDFGETNWTREHWFILADLILRELARGAFDPGAQQMFHGRPVGSREALAETLRRMVGLYFGEGLAGRLKRCGACERWFADLTRNRSQRRCSLACTQRFWNRDRRRVAGHPSQARSLARIVEDPGAAQAAALEAKEARREVEVATLEAQVTELARQIAKDAPRRGGASRRG